MINGTSQITFPQALVGALLGRPSPSPINSRVSGAESLIRAAAEMDPVAMGQALDRLRGTGSPSHAVCYLFADEVPTVFTGPDPSRVMLMADRAKVPVVRESVVLYETGLIKSCVLTQDWADPKTRAIFKSGTQIQFGEGGNVQSGTLAQSWTWRFGDSARALPAGTIINLRTPQQSVFWIYGILGEDWVDPQTGAVFKSGTPIELHTEGWVGSGTLARNWVHSSRGCYQAGTEIVLNYCGDVFSGTLAEPFLWRSRYCLPKGTIVQFEQGRTYCYVSSCSLVENWVDPETGAIFKSGTQIGFHESQLVDSGTLAQDWTSAQTRRTYKSGKRIKFHMSGRVESGTLVFVMHGGLSYLEGTVDFDDEGRVKRGILANNTRWGEGNVYFRGERDIEFHPLGGGPKKATLAGDCEIEGHRLSGGIEVEFDEKGQLVFGV